MKRLASKGFVTRFCYKDPLHLIEERYKKLIKIINTVLFSRVVKGNIKQSNFPKSSHIKSLIQNKNKLRKNYTKCKTKYSQIL